MTWLLCACGHRSNRHHGMGYSACGETACGCNKFTKCQGAPAGERDVRAHRPSRPDDNLAVAVHVKRPAATATASKPKDEA